MFYAQINLTTRIVEAETMPHSPIDAPHMIEVSAEQYGTLLGKRHDEQTGAFVDVPVVVPVDPCQHLIDLGPFYDRFAAAKMAVLTSTDAGVKAILQDVSIRKWIDLQRADVASALGYIGSVVPALTGALQTAILTTPVTAEENRALRKLYF